MARKHSTLTEMNWSVEAVLKLHGSGLQYTIKINIELGRGSSSLPALNSDFKSARCPYV
ncbi:hypothetical protein [Paenibacillus campi]|uniref:hypothetical protein n=1 Tax=Paenibacillus campi TaxID=3106031 RepID=UPI002AFFAAA5|nr:hypothetical protein [Paenibacillus sp. SGZ-1014]